MPTCRELQSQLRTAQRKHDDTELQYEHTIARGEPSSVEINALVSKLNSLVAEMAHIRQQQTAQNCY